MAIAPERNPPLNPQYYNPSQFFISAVTLGVTTTITATADLNFPVGQEIRLLIPTTFGCRQLNGVTGFVVSVPSSTQVVTSINSSQNVDPFILSSATTQAQIIPVGDINSGQINSSGRINNLTYINGSFINISPA